MAQPLRKIFQKNLLPGADAWRGARAEGRQRPQEGGRAGAREGRAPTRPRRTLDLSGAATAALGLALVAAVGWAFFMGYLVGRGEHPERGVESVAGLLRPGPQGPGATAPRKPLPGEEVLQAAPAPEGAPANAAPAPPEGQAPVGVETREAPAGAGAPGPAPAAPAPESPPAPAAPAYPFSRPQGEGLAAWGISEGAPPQAANQAAQTAPAQAAARPAAAAAAQPGAQKAARGGAPAASRAPGAASPPQPAQPRFDYIFQAAAFKGPVDAERLRARLEAAGLRARVRPSGKVRLVLVAVRGSAEEAKRVRGQLSGMGLGRPILLEKKPAEEKTGGKGRRRSAP